MSLPRRVFLLLLIPGLLVDPTGVSYAFSTLAIPAVRTAGATSLIAPQALAADAQQALTPLHHHRIDAYQTAFYAVPGMERYRPGSELFEQELRSFAKATTDSDRATAKARVEQALRVSVPEDNPIPEALTKAFWK